MAKINWFRYFIRGIGGYSKYNQDGVRIELINRDRYQYTEGEHCLTFVAEMLGGKTNYVIASSSITEWQSPFDKESITEQDKQRILTNIGNFFNYYGYSYKIE